MNPMSHTLPYHSLLNPSHGGIVAMGRSCLALLLLLSCRLCSSHLMMMINLLMVKDDPFINMELGFEQEHVMLVLLTVGHVDWNGGQGLLCDLS